ncbi:MAG: START domain-containing protein [Planctomycetota bacterium]|nr:START domain-containing protein [Planctomycetota bacterium]
MRFYVLSLMVVLFATAPVYGQDRWERVLQKSGISVYSKPFTGPDLMGFRGIVDIPAAPRKVLAVLMNNRRKKEWIWGLEDTRVLKRSTKHDMIVYQSFRLSALVSDRDFVFRGKATRDKRSGWIHLRCKSVSFSKAPKTVGVRGELLHNNFTLIPLNKGKRTRVIMDCLGDPKGWIPKWLLRRTQKNWPVEILWGLRTQCSKKDYALYPEPPVEKSKSKP